MSSNSIYRENLINRVIANSIATSWDSAVLEWEIEDCEEDEDLLSSCICGKERLRYLFTIVNKYNGCSLYPIGSTCIKKFSRRDLDESASIQIQMFTLLHAIENNDFISLSNEYFSRKLLAHLYSVGAFTANEYNNHNPVNDYEFMLKMFNKKSRGTISTAQRRKISAIIMNSIRPYLYTILQDKTNI